MLLENYDEPDDPDGDRIGWRCSTRSLNWTSLGIPTTASRSKWRSRCR